MINILTGGEAPTLCYHTLNYVSIPMVMPCKVHHTLGQTDLPLFLIFFFLQLLIGIEVLISLLLSCVHLVREVVDDLVLKRLFCGAQTRIIYR